MKKNKIIITLLVAAMVMASTVTSFAYTPGESKFMDDLYNQMEAELMQGILDAYSAPYVEYEEPVEEVVPEPVPTPSNLIEAVFGQIQLYVNGEYVEQETLLYNGTTYVPLRAVTEILGGEIQYDEYTGSANIVTDGGSYMNFGN